MNNNGFFSYTPFNKALHISQGSLDYFITYGPDRLRRKTTLLNGATDDVLLTKYYAFTSPTGGFGDYEKVTDATGTRHLHYLQGGDGLAAVYVKNEGGADSLYFILKDHLGSIVGAINSENGTVHRQSFDAWGRKRNPENWSYSNIPDFIFDRGYTGHEHLKWFGLINMNGRMYDAALCRFLSPDPFVQMPDYTQNFNRYSYALNNPLVYTDPSGEFLIPALMIGAFVNVVMQGWSGNAQTPGDFALAAGIGALSGAAGAGAGAVVGGMLSGASTLGGSIANGAIVGAAGGFAGGFMGGSGNAWAGGASFGQGLEQGLIGGGLGALGGAVIGGITGGVRFQKQMGVFRKGLDNLGVQANEAVPATDDFLNQSQQAWYQDAPMDNVNKFTVENVPQNHLNSPDFDTPFQIYALKALYTKEKCSDIPKSVVRKHPCSSA